MSFYFLQKMRKFYNILDLFNMELIDLFYQDLASQVENSIYEKLKK